MDRNVGNRLMELEDKEVTACLDSCTITVDMVLNKLRLFFFLKILRCLAWTTSYQVIKDTPYPRTAEEDAWYAFLAGLLFLFWKILLENPISRQFGNTRILEGRQRSSSALCADYVLEVSHALRFCLC